MSNVEHNADCVPPEELVRWFDLNLTHDTFRDWSNERFAQELTPLLRQAWIAGVRETYHGHNVEAYIKANDPYVTAPVVTHDSD